MKIFGNCTFPRLAKCPGHAPHPELHSPEDAGYDKCMFVQIVLFENFH